MEAIATPAIPKRIALFSDGTGNSSAKAQKTNVWRLFEALDQSKGEQIAMYDDGVGTSSNKYLALLGGAFGWGLKRNVINLYKFVCRNYRQGDDIYGFGFSRGAFTIRVLTGLIAREGLVAFRSEEELDHHAAAAYRSFRYKAFPSKSPIVWVFRRLRDLVLHIRNRIMGYGGYRAIAAATREADRHAIPIRFLGLWDTVEAYGMPIEELKRGIDWVLWPMLFGDMKLSPSVRRAVHALSLDDERTTFHPLLWDELWEAELAANNPAFAGRITQVWFAGVHSNVGGGYPEDRLSLVPLEWIMEEAANNGLTFIAGSTAKVTAEKSHYARLYDSRAGLAAYYRYSPRKIPLLALRGGAMLANVHWSVVMRMVYGSDSYAPITLPHNFKILTPNGALLKFDELSYSLQGHGTLTTANADLDAAVKQLGCPDHDEVGLVWDTVFWRRCLYALTMILSLAALSFPAVSQFLPDQWSSRIDSAARGPISTIVAALSAAIPSYASLWKESLLRYPLEFGVLLVAIALTLLGSHTLEERIHDRARLTWHRGPVANYRDWRKQSRSGFGRLMMFCLILLAAATAVAWLAGRGDLVLGFAVTGALLLFGWGLSVVAHQERANARQTRVRSTLALKVARAIRANRTLLWLFGGLTKKVIPLAFAAMLLLAGTLVSNRAVFDTMNSAGLFCTGSLGTGAQQTSEKLGEAKTFTTDSLCWATGLVLKKGHRYLITLTTRDHAADRWFDRDVPTDVTGFATDSARHWMAKPLTRWWNQNWFKPIGRIGRFGNDEYVLDPIDDVAPAAPPRCSALPRLPPGLPIGTKIDQRLAQDIDDCVPVAADRLVLHSEVKAKSDGELFLYVNDAVIAIPGLQQLFFDNNSGSAVLRVERLTSSAVAAESTAPAAPQP